MSAAPLQADIAATIAANRFGLGARPGELDQIGADARGWLERQLDGVPAPLADRSLQSSDAILREAAALRGTRDGPPRAAGQADVGGLLRLPQLFRPIYMREAAARLRHAVATDRSFLERL